MSVQIIDNGDKCPACQAKDVLRSATEQGVVRQCRKCNCAWAIAKDAISEEAAEEENDDGTGK
jgi:Zn ribbon nucleic-acid-binding protein